MPYAVGDIHGHTGQLDRALALIAADGEGSPVVFLGDCTDRGPDSPGVLDRLIAERDRGAICLLGNHDRMFLRAIRDGVVTDPAITSGKTWLHPALGGAATLAAYGVRLPDADRLAELHRRPDSLADLMAAAREAVPADHLAFLESLPTTHVTDDQVFVHAGLRPGVPLAEQTEDDLVWIREPFLSDDRDHGRLIVHGHTALDAARHFGNRVDLDSGAGYGRPITSAWIDGAEAWALSGGGRVALRP